MVVYLAFHHLKTSRNAKMSSKLLHACSMLQNYIVICRLSIKKNAEFRMSILKRNFFFRSRRPLLVCYLEFGKPIIASKKHYSLAWYKYFQINILRTLVKTFPGYYLNFGHVERSFVMFISLVFISSAFSFMIVIHAL